MPWKTKLTLHKDDANTVGCPTQQNRRLQRKKQPGLCRILAGNGNVQAAHRDALCVDKARELPAGVVPDSTQLQDAMLG